MSGGLGQQLQQAISSLPTNMQNYVGGQGPAGGGGQGAPGGGGTWPGFGRGGMPGRFNNSTGMGYGGFGQPGGMFAGPGGGGQQPYGPGSYSSSGAMPYGGGSSMHNVRPPPQNPFFGGGGGYPGGYNNMAYGLGGLNPATSGANSPYGPLPFQGAEPRSPVLPLGAGSGGGPGQGSGKTREGKYGGGR